MLAILAHTNTLIDANSPTAINTSTIVKPPQATCFDFLERIDFPRLLLV
jgi:hypothetical protein